MKNLPEHSPKSDAWEKILSRGDFDAQCRGLIAELPVFTPKASSWDRIEAALDEKRILPPWVYWAAASAVIGLILGIGVFMPTFENKKDRVLSTIDLPKSTRVAPPENTEDPTTISATETIHAVPKQRKPKRKATEAIEIRKIPLPEIKLSPDESLGLVLPDTPLAESIPPPTLHQVRISWTKFKPSMQVRTTFGRTDSKQPDKQQASAQKGEHISIEIKN